MKFKNVLILTLIVVPTVGMLPARPSAPTPEPVVVEDRTDVGLLAAQSAGALEELNYSLTARIRLLIPWLSFKDVGGARIVLARESERLAGLELLIGSDPQRTPMKINRWGYICERLHDPGFQMVGVMTEVKDASVNEARADAEGGESTTRFKAIRAFTGEGEAHSSVIHLPPVGNLTFRDIEKVLEAIPEKGAEVRSTALPDDVFPGFLVAVKELIHRNVASFEESGEYDGGGPLHCRYLYNGNLYEMTLKPHKFRKSFTEAETEHHSLIEGHFETRKIGVDGKTKFEITYGTAGSIKETPVEIVYQPKWWFQARLHLDPRVSF